MTNTQTIASPSSSATSPLAFRTRKRRTHSEMERGSFPPGHASSSAAAAAIVAAAETMASHIDLVCGSGANTSHHSHSSSPSGSDYEDDPDHERRPLIQQQSQSKTQKPNSSEQSYQNSHHQQQQHRHSSMPSFPHLDMNLHMENIDFQALPEEIQMALEDTLLGWTHLTSITIGHILLPWLVFCAVQRASKYVLEQTVYTIATAAEPSTSSSVGATSSSSSTTYSLEGEFGQAVEAVLVSATTHTILGAVAAIAAFRIIRHRRRVWFRHAYGSAGYKSCQEGRRRREAVLEADRRRTSLLSLSSGEAPAPRLTWTSQIFTNLKRKRHKKKLQRASDRFERHHTGLTPTNRRPSISVSQSGGSSRRMNNSWATSSQKFWREDYDSTSIAPTEDCYDSASTSSSSDHGNENPSSPTDDHDCPNRSSIAHDAVSIPRIHNVPYAHGGFFGAAPFFLADRRWVKILRELLPDVYVEISRRVGGGYYYGYYVGSVDYRSDASKLIHWAENNPVVAAYGVVMDLQIKQELATEEREIANTGDDPLMMPKLENFPTRSGSIIDQFYQNKTSLGGDASNIKTKRENKTTEKETIDIPNLEWDIFVDPQLVRRVEAVLNSMDRYIASKTQQQNSSNINGRHNDKSHEEFGTTLNTSSSSSSGVAEPNRTDCDECAYCKGANGDSDDDIALLDEDSGKSEAAALLADHDHNQSSMSLNNLCGSHTNVCNDCFQTTENSTSPGGGKSSKNFSSDFFEDSSPSQSDFGSNMHLRESLKNDPVMIYLERELKRRTQELTDRLLIAHGNVLQLMMEQSGVLKDWNYSRVQRTRRTLGGGMYARQWMAVFAEALRLGMKPQSKRKSGRGSPSSLSPNSACRSIDGGITEEPDNFCDREDDGAGLGETDALIPPRRNNEDWKEDPYDDDGDPLYDEDRDDPVVEDHNHCTCSPRCCLDTTMVESLRMIEKITKTKQPIGILLDLKSRHVPKRVLSLMVRSLQAAGLRVVGIASFEISEIRGVCSHHYHHNLFEGSQNSQTHPVSGKIPAGIKPCATKEILMVHSAGDLQAACDEGLVRPGDHVFFNGGSLILDSARSSTIKSLAGFFFDMCVCGYYNTFDPCVIENGYRIQSYGYACSSMDAMDAANCFPDTHYGGITGGNATNGLKRDHQVGEDDEEETLIMSSSEDTEMAAAMRTLADYKRHYGFSMGLYLQEFSIDVAAARLLIDLVNQNPTLYDLGLAWGGINGMTVHGIQPGRFTSTDGYWNQRRLGRVWRDHF